MQNLIDFVQFPTWAPQNQVVFFQSIHSVLAKRGVQLAVLSLILVGQVIKCLQFEKSFAKTPPEYLSGYLDPEVT
jgi:hypothetical protein